MLTENMLRVTPITFCSSFPIYISGLQTLLSILCKLVLVEHGSKISQFGSIIVVDTNATTLENYSPIIEN